MRFLESMGPDEQKLISEVNYMCLNDSLLLSDPKRLTELKLKYFKWLAYSSKYKAS